MRPLLAFAIVSVPPLLACCCCAGGGNTAATTRAARQTPAPTQTRQTVDLKTAPFPYRGEVVGHWIMDFTPTHSQRATLFRDQGKFYIGYTFTDGGKRREEMRVGKHRDGWRLDYLEKPVGGEYWLLKRSSGNIEIKDEGPDSWIIRPVGPVNFAPLPTR